MRLRPRLRRLLAATLALAGAAGAADADGGGLAADHSGGLVLAQLRAARAETSVSTAEQAKAPTIDTYVINKASRRDRYECMRKQLAHAPQAVYFQTAVEAGDYDAACGHLPADPDAAAGWGHDVGAERSLFCSNYGIWARANASAADFIIVMEDDAYVSTHFWEYVTRFLEKCGRDVDLVVVDPHHVGEVGDRRSCPGIAHELLIPGKHAGNSYGNWLGFWGTHVQILRKEYVATLLAEAALYGAGAVDKWWVLHTNGRKAAWLPGITRQLRFVEESPCDASVAGSDILLHDNSSSPPSAAV